MELVGNNSKEIKRSPGDEKCTFEVTVCFQQNATWQGRILWMEKNGVQNFRSALEMLKLMDEALTEVSDNSETIKWHQ